MRTCPTCRGPKPSYQRECANCAGREENDSNPSIWLAVAVIIAILFLFLTMTALISSP